MEVLGKRLKWLRNQNRYSQKEMAEKIGMSASGLQKIENNERDPKLDILVKFCDIYKVSADFLLGRNNETPELEDVSQNILFAFVRHERFKEELNELLMKKYDLESSIRHMEYTLKSDECIHDRRPINDSLKQRKFILESIEKDIVNKEKDLRSVNKELSDNLYHYLSVLLELPEAEPSEDHNVKRFAPYNFEIQPDIFGEYSIHLSGKGIGFIGHYGVYESVDAATDKIEELKIILNGNQHENILR